MQERDQIEREHPAEAAAADDSLQRGPRGRERFFLEIRGMDPQEREYATPTPRAEADAERARASAVAERLAPPGLRQDLVRRFRERQRSAVRAFEADAAVPAPANNWIPIGPSVVRRGQGAVRPAVSGRVAGLALTGDGRRVYVAAANGGVWRSDDGGGAWRSTMDGWDLNPSHFQSDSLACGAIALDPADPDRVYVGTGEGASGDYFGVGPIRTDNGGVDWHTEPVAPGSLPLEGSSFYELALDPGNRERVVAAAGAGLFRREPDGSGGFHWAEKWNGSWTSVVAASQGGVTTFYAAAWGYGKVLCSPDGDTWTEVGAGFPASDLGRIGLAVRPNDPTVVYALVADRRHHLLGVWRLDVADGRWRPVSGAPATLFGTDLNEQGQGGYDLAIAVDPNDKNRIYLGGSTLLAGGQWSASLYRCVVSARGTGPALTYSMAPKYIGGDVHADVHTLRFAGASSDRLWVGCDGGVFSSENVSGQASFASRNAGLATLTMNHLGVHPTQDAVLFCGSQDNGTLRYTGEEAWLHSCWGDGGYCVVHPTDPYRVLRTYVGTDVDRTLDGGPDYTSWEVGGNLKVPDPGGSLFYAPLVGPPPASVTGRDADLLAFGGKRPWISRNFGTTWTSIPAGGASDALPHKILSLVFGSATRLYAGTIGGGVYRFDQMVGGTWRRTQLDATGATAPPALPVTCIAVDPAASDTAIYVTYGGRGDFRRVWRFDGSGWEPRSGPAESDPASLLNVQHNAIVVDPENPLHLYAAADIGVWHSRDGGAAWEVYSQALPDAAVLDLKLHPDHRLLWATTYGRGIFERTLDELEARPVEVYVRHTQLDRGRRPSEDGLDDPTRQGARVQHALSPDIKVDVPSATGVYQTPTREINFFQFTDTINDNSDRVETVITGAGPLKNRVFVLVHNRGIAPAHRTRVTLLLGRGATPPALPVGFEEKVRSGEAIRSPDWRTVGVQSLSDVVVGDPRVASFELLSSDLPTPSELPGAARCWLLALIHTPEADEFQSSEPNVDVLTTTERLAALRQITVVKRPTPPPSPLRIAEPPVLDEVNPVDPRPKPVTKATATVANTYVWAVGLLFAGMLAIQWFYGLYAIGRSTVWTASVTLLLLSTAAIGWGQMSRVDGFLIDERNRISLSRLQILLWTALILPALSLTVLGRLTPHQSPAMKAALHAAGSAAAAKARAEQMALEERATTSRVAAGDAKKKAETLKTEADRLAEASAVAKAGAAATEAAVSAVGTAATVEQKKRLDDARAAAEAASVKYAQAATTLQLAEQQRELADRTAATADAQVTAGREAASAGQPPVNPFPTLPGTLLALMGISLTTAVASPLLLKPKKDVEASSDAKAGATVRAAAAGQAQPEWVGTVAVRSHPSEARWSDLFEGEEVANCARVDPSRLQNLYLTLILVAAYAATLYHLFEGAGLVRALPDLSPEMITLLGISHAGYLTAKAISRTPEGQPGAGDAPGTAPGRLQTRVEVGAAGPVLTLYGLQLGKPGSQPTVMAETAGGAAQELTPISMQPGKLVLPLPGGSGETRLKVLEDGRPTGWAVVQL